MTLWSPTANLVTPARYIFDPNSFTYSGSNFSSGTNQGSVGGSWTVESGTPVKGTQLNSRNVIAFDGTMGFLNNTANWPIATNVYVFAVVSVPNRGPKSLCSHSWYTGEGADWVYYPRGGVGFGGSADEAWIFNSATAIRTRGDLHTDASYHITCIKLGSSDDLRLDGSTASITGAALGSILNSATGNFRVGASGPSANEAITANLAYLAVLVDPTLDEIQKLEGWAAAPAQFNMQASLPVGHPFKSAAPVVGFNITAGLINEALLAATGSFRYPLAASLVNAASLAAPSGSLYFNITAGLANQASLGIAPSLYALIKAILANQVSLVASASQPSVSSRALLANLTAQALLTGSATQIRALKSALAATAALTSTAIVKKTIRASFAASASFVEKTFRLGLDCQINANVNFSAQGSLLTSWKGIYFTVDDSVKRLGRKATWNVRGVDTDVAVTDFGSYFQLHLTGQAEPEEFYINDAWPQYSYITPDDSWKRLVTIAPQTVAPYRIAIGPSLQAVEARPELIKVPGKVGYDMFVGSNLFPHDGAGVYMAPSDSPPPKVINGLPIFPSFLLPSTSDLRIFNRYSVFDPDDLPTGGTQGTMFCGLGYFDFPPFTAEVDVFMAGVRSQAEFVIDDFMMPNGRYLIPQDNRPLAYVAGAIEAARGLTQLTLLQPKPTPLFVAGKPFIVGTDHYVIGQSQLAV